MSSINHARHEDDRLGNKTLFIKPIAGKLRHDEILDYFSAFGDVKHVRIYNKRKYSYGFVTFTQPESSSKALEVDSHIIFGRRVKVAAADHRYRDRTMLQDLNDDCIIEILSMKCLTVIDLCSLAETCRRIKEIAGRVFRREHKECDIRSLIEGNAKTAQRILMNFGSEIRHLRIDGLGAPDEWTREMLASAIQYCSSSTLQALHLRSLKFPENLTSKLNPLFKNLQTLTIVHCSIEGVSKNLFGGCGSLVNLSIRNSEDVAALVCENTFPKLQQFECRCEGDSFESFITRHINLKALSIGFVGSSVLQRIADCKQLEILYCDIGGDENDRLDLSKLRCLCLRELKVFCFLRNATETLLGLENLQPLEHLQLSLAKIDSEFVRALSQLKRLQVLELRDCYSLQNWNGIAALGELITLDIYAHVHVDFDVLLLVERLGKLNFLNIRVPRFEFDLETYSRIVDVVRRTPGRSKLTFRLHSCEGVSYDHLLPQFARNAHLVEMILEDEK